MSCRVVQMANVYQGPPTIIQFSNIFFLSEFVQEKRVQSKHEVHVNCTFTHNAQISSHLLPRWYDIIVDFKTASMMLIFFLIPLNPRH